MPPRRVGPLRVLFVVPDLGVGGAERHVATLAPALDPQRFAPSVVCIGDEGALFGGLVEAGIPAPRAAPAAQPGGRAAPGWSAVMRRDRPDVVITRGYNAEALGRIAAVLTRTPRSVVWVHNCGDVVPRGRIRGLVDRLLEPATDAYYAVAHGQRPYMTDVTSATRIGRSPWCTTGWTRAGSRVRASRSATPRWRPSSGSTLSAPVIGIVAVLRPEKDHATLLRAVRMVRDEIPDAQLLVVGDGPERPRLEALAAELGIDVAVRFAGSRLRRRAAARPGRRGRRSAPTPSSASRWRCWRPWPAGCRRSAPRSAGSRR